MPAPEDGVTFHAPAPRVAWFSDIIGANVPADAPLRILDIGCGAGDQLFDLAARLRRARFVGVDIAPANIAAARQRQSTLPDANRFMFEAVDYRLFRPLEPFDAVISYSVLQFVPGGVTLLASRIAADTSPDGVFINVMPYRCAYNAALSMGRRGFRAVRSAAIDRLLMLVARTVHGHSLDADLLAERLAYAYAVPDQFEDELASALEQFDFRTVRRTPAAHASPAQLKHVLRIMRRAT